MTLITFNTTEELKNLLKQEENQSALITRLLWDYFNSFQKIDITKQENNLIQLEKEIINKKQEMDKFIKQEEIQKINKEEEERIKTKHDAETKHLREVILKEIDDGNQTN